MEGMLIFVIMPLLALSIPLNIVMQVSELISMFFGA